MYNSVQTVQYIGTFKYLLFFFMHEPCNTLVTCNKHVWGRCARALFQSPSSPKLKMAFHHHMKTKVLLLEIQTSAIIEANNMSDGTPPGYMNDEKMVGDEGGARDDAADTKQDIYQSLDPLDPRKVSLDIFEMYCHEMVNTPSVGRRAYLINKMKVSCFILTKLHDVLCFAELLTSYFLVST